MRHYHYHVLMGLRGCYMPNTNDVYKTRREAEKGALFWADQYREEGKRVIGNQETDYFIPEISESITITKCSDDCMTERCQRCDRVLISIHKTNAADSSLDCGGICQACHTKKDYSIDANF